MMQKGYFFVVMGLVVLFSILTAAKAEEQLYGQYSFLKTSLDSAKKNQAKAPAPVIKLYPNFGTPVLNYASQYHVCLIGKQQERDVQNRALLTSMYKYVKTLHGLVYEVFKWSVRVLDRDDGRISNAYIAYKVIPDFLLDQFDNRPAFRNLAILLSQIRQQTAEFLILLGLDKNDPLLEKDFISRAEIELLASDVSRSRKLKNVGFFSPEANLGLNLLESPALVMGDKLMSLLGSLMNVKLDGLELALATISLSGSQTKLPTPKTKEEKIALAKTILVTQLSGQLSNNLVKWNADTRGFYADCEAERELLGKASDAYKQNLDIQTAASHPAS